MQELRDHLLRQADYSRWATGELLRACAALAPHELTKQLGASHSSIVQTLCHMFDAERVWLARLEGERDGALPAGYAPQLDFDALVSSWPNMSAAWRRRIAETEDPALSEPLSTMLPGGNLWRHSRAEIVLHVTTHASLHRGQIVSMLRALGRTPPTTDFTAFNPNR
jgi:uncharacterized damage-inducible protein DinB